MQVCDQKTVPRFAYWQLTTSQLTQIRLIIMQALGALLIQTIVTSVAMLNAQLSPCSDITNLPRPGSFFFIGKG